jgi:hypothetical protein
MNPVESCLAQHAADDRSVFVFPTETAASRWADRLLELRGCGTVALDRFLAWDTFKAESIRSEKQDKKSIPAPLRKICVLALLDENAQRCAAGEAPLFHSLVNPQYAQSAQSFAPWLTGLLPSLARWAERSAAGGLLDQEDRDLRLLYERYGQFLDANGLFEPAWEQPPFSGSGRRCFIFFPELIEDFGEYQALLESAPGVTILRAAPDAGEWRSFLYRNSREELRRAADYIRDLAETKAVPYDRIAVSVPDRERYGPYLLRELALRNIPVVTRAGKSLASYPAGSFFAALSDCVSSRFSFASLTALLANPRLPWKEPDVISRLIDFGIQNNCRVSWEEGTGEEGTEELDVWEDAFAGFAGAREQKAASFYRTLKKQAAALVAAKTFDSIRTGYFAFRGAFFDTPMSGETDVILSRCISELMALVDIERSFPNVPCASPYAFFTDCLREKLYLPQQNERGVNIFPYRLAASAPFDCHIVIGATQKRVLVTYAELGFLRQDKRLALGLADTDASASFIRHYALASLKAPAAFFCAEETFEGYAIPHSALETGSSENSEKSVENRERDPFVREAAVFLRPDAEAPEALFSAQAAGFDAWRGAHAAKAPTLSAPIPAVGRAELKRRIHDRFAGRGENSGRLRVSASALKDYFACPLRWLDTQVFGVHTKSRDAPLTEPTVYGQLCHGALNLFFAGVKAGLAFPGNRGILQALGDSQALSPEYAELLESSLDQTLGALPVLPGGRPDNRVSLVASRLFRAQRSALRSRLTACLTGFLREAAGFRVMETEQWFEAAPEGADYYLGGKIDLTLNKTPEGDFQPVIIDFKTGAPPGKKECVKTGEGDVTDFQLALYSMLYEANTGVPVREARFFSISGAKASFIFGPEEGPEYAATMDEVKAKIAQYAAALREADCAAFAKPDWETCAACAHRFSCRTTYTVAPSSFGELQP